MQSPAPKKKVYNYILQKLDEIENSDEDMLNWHNYPHPWSLRNDESLDRAQNNERAIIIALPANKNYYCYETLFNTLTDAVKEQLKIWGWGFQSYNEMPYVIFEPNMGTPVKNIPEYLYHTTLDYYIEKILIQGIKPSDNYSSYGRVYLATSLDAAYLLRDSMVYDERTKGELRSILMVDTKKFRANYYIDPYYEQGGIWTPTHIPASAVSLVQDSWDDHEHDDVD